MKSFFECVTAARPAPLDYKPAGRLTLEKAFEVYQRGYAARLIETLGDTFENVWKVLGDELFFQIAGEFLRQQPSESYSLGDYSPAFVAFLRDHSVTGEFPFLPDLAQMAWSKKQSFNARAERGLSGEALLELLTDDQGRTTFVEHFFLFRSKYSLEDIWQALNLGTEPLQDWERPQFLAFYRFENTVYLKGFQEASWTALDLIRQGQTLFRACEDLNESDLTSLFQFLSTFALLKKT